MATLSSEASAPKNPLKRMALERAAAREKNDGWAALCTLGTVNAKGDAEQRTLVLREMDKRLALFFSARAPKWQELKTRPTCSIQFYLPSIEVQYRIRASWALIDPQRVRESWVMRPDIPKKLDWLYEQHPQSTPIDRDELLAKLSATQAVPDKAPESSMGVYLDPLAIERLQLSSGVHTREQWTRESAGDEIWQHRYLVP